MVIGNEVDNLFLFGTQHPVFLQCLSTCMNIIEELKDTRGDYQLFNVYIMSIIYPNLKFEQNFFDDG